MLSHYGSFSSFIVGKMFALAFVLVVESRMFGQKSFTSDWPALMIRHTGENLTMLWSANWPWRSFSSAAMLSALRVKTSTDVW